VAFAVSIVAATLLAGVAVSLGAGVNDPVTTTVSFLGEWVGFVGVPVFLSRTRGSGRLATDFGLRLGGPGDLGVGLLVGFGLFGLVAAYSVVLRQFDHANLGHEAQQLSGHGLGLGFAAFALVAVVGAPIAEELYFRGLIQPVLQRRIGAIAGWIATSVIFGVVHLAGNPAEAVPPLVLVGLAVGLLAWRTGRLGPGIVAHMTFNGITVAALALSR